MVRESRPRSRMSGAWLGRRSVPGTLRGRGGPRVSGGRGRGGEGKAADRRERHRGWPVAKLPAGRAAVMMPGCGRRAATD
ncbi:hypothetical protein PSMK_11620 [Phycisphaera mikurensis NBRC 102666]|uniref:Uncharacterized protein n=1 Tax=Phycisphaera mikurensis (strain NBRC 102666 / KCTC 22515 / FYK2301M01) TaxID=1142394 RepID=I0IDI3_PHYMF|nr:hypothetical protein PSMK_11620 [Phycisphaera mikurensis NBRC 102666]